MRSQIAPAPQERWRPRELSSTELDGVLYMLHLPIPSPPVHLERYEVDTPLRRWCGAALDIGLRRGHEPFQFSPGQGLLRRAELAWAPLGAHLGEDQVVSVPRYYIYLSPGTTEIGGKDLAFAVRYSLAISSPLAPSLLLAVGTVRAPSNVANVVG